MRGRLLAVAVCAALITAPAISQDVRNTYIAVAAQVADNTITLAKLNGLGTGIATALGVNVGTAGAPVINGGVLGTPSSGTATNLSGTAASLTAGTVTTNANLTGDVTSAGNATTLAATARLKSKIITSSRDLTTASGSQALTGMGFQPTACVATGGSGSSSTAYNSIFGISDSSRANSVNAMGATAGIQLTVHLMMFMDGTGSNFQTVDVASYDADGLTLTWTKTGSPTGTMSFYIMCFR